MQYINPNEYENDLQLTIAQVIKKYGFLRNKGHSKAFGQHFLCDYSLLQKIVNCAGKINPNVDVIEVGPGPLGLTRTILDILPEESSLFAIEKDTNFKDAHNNIKKHTTKKLNFIYQDALKILPQHLTQKPVIIISNLPYNVGTQILLNWLKYSNNQIQTMILMFQKEVADRICAKTNTKSYGRLSIISQLLCHTEKLFDVSKLAFFPPPKVTSSVVKLTPKNIKINFSNLEQFTNLCFQFRRKTMFSILKKHFGHIKNLEELLQNFNIDKTQRPETISPESFLKLSQKLLNN